MPAPHGAETRSGGAGTPVIPEFALQEHGIAPYYGDAVLVFDTVDST